LPSSRRSLGVILVPSKPPADTSHPDPAQLESFTRGRLNRAENRMVVRHLLTGCRTCAAVTRPLLGHPDNSLLRPETGTDEARSA
jgi:hypothetical protein